MILYILPLIFAILISFNCKVLAKRLPVDQFQASCFPGCRCNSTSFVCENLGERSTELFRHVLPQIYPDLDTLVVTGNQFGPLVDENIFGSNPSNLRHPKLSLVNLSSNEIRSFGAQTFIGMPRVEYLYLSNNKLESIDSADLNPLTYFTSLKYLDLSRAFGSRLSAKGRAQLLKTFFFGNDHSLMDLQDIILSSNDIEYLESDTFCQVKGLTRLNLADNKLSTFKFRKGNCLETVQMLDLSGNLIQTVPASFVSNLPSLNTIDVSRNPLKCDCDLAPFHEFAIGEKNSFLNQQNTVCAEPKTLAGRKFFELDSICESYNKRSSSRVLSFLFITVLAVGIAFLVYRQYRTRGYLFRRRTTMTTLLTDMDGYSQLNAMDEANYYKDYSDDQQQQNLPPPAFV